MSKTHSISLKFNLLNALVVVLGLGVIALIYLILTPVGESFGEYRRQALEREQLLMELRRNFGYGGGIHNFKNYVLRGQRQYFDRALMNGEQIMSSVQRYRALSDLSAEEVGALDAIAETAQRYRDMLDKVSAQVALGATPAAMDKLVKISDKAALQGFETLEKRFNDLTEHYVRTLDDTIAHSLNWVVWCTLAGLLLSSILIHLLKMSVTVPLSRAVGAMAAIAQGDGDLTRRLAPSSHRELDQFTAYFNRFVSNVQTLVSSILAVSAQLQEAAGQVSVLSQATNEGVGRQQSQVEQAATAVSQLASQAQQVAGSAGDNSSATAGADQEARDGQGVVGQSIATVERLATVVDRGAEVIGTLREDTEGIGGVLDVIRGIAEQTNLLALNAAIEAARAGDKGRGFAVVADEVRALAQRTQESTQEIQGMVQRLQARANAAVDAMVEGRSQARDGVTQVERAGQALQSITAAVTAIRERNQQIAVAAQEQSAVCEAVHDSINHITEEARRNAQAARETYEIGDRIVALGGQLHGLVGQFKVEAAS